MEHVGSRLSGSQPVRCEPGSVGSDKGPAPTTVGGNGMTNAVSGSLARTAVVDPYDFYDRLRDAGEVVWGRGNRTLADHLSRGHSELSFNVGPRKCAGAALARAEFQETISRSSSGCRTCFDPAVDQPQLDGFVLRSYRPLHALIEPRVGGSARRLRTLIRDAFDNYVSVWSRHGQDDDAGAVARELKRLVSDDMVYVDVPSGHAFHGPDGVGRMCAVASEHYRPAISIVGTVLDGERFAIEFTSEITAAGTSISSTGVAVGTIAPDGKVTSHRDYYDASALSAALRAASKDG